jgi:hypothetical protein
MESDPMTIKYYKCNDCEGEMCKLSKDAIVNPIMCVEVLGFECNWIKITKHEFMGD